MVGGEVGLGGGVLAGVGAGEEAVFGHLEGVPARPVEFGRRDGRMDEGGARFGDGPRPGSFGPPSVAEAFAPGDLHVAFAHVASAGRPRHEHGALP